MKAVRASINRQQKLNARSQTHQQLKTAGETENAQEQQYLHNAQATAKPTMPPPTIATSSTSGAAFTPPTSWVRSYTSLREISASSRARGNETSIRLPRSNHSSLQPPHKTQSRNPLSPKAQPKRREKERGRDTVGERLREYLRPGNPAWRRIRARSRRVAEGPGERPDPIRRRREASVREEREHESQQKCPGLEGRCGKRGGEMDRAPAHLRLESRAETAEGPIG